jgi:hypothetical protein
MTALQNPIARRITEATSAVFGESTVAIQVQQVCAQYEKDLDNIQSGRGINALLIAIVGAKGQGKTWIARQLVRSDAVRDRLHSGDLIDDATIKLVWIGPVPPDGLDTSIEIYYPCPTNDMIEVGQPFVILDTPGITDANQNAAKIAKESLSLAPVKLIAIARDQIRAAANLSLARQIDGSICIPIVTSVEPSETDSAELADDLRVLREQLSAMAPHSQLLPELKIPDFEITGDEAASGGVLRSGLLDRLTELGVSQGNLRSARESRIQSANSRLKSEITQLISRELPQLAEAVSQLNRETEALPSRVLASLLGSEKVLETGIRMRLRARFVDETSLLWFPYRTVLSILNFTHGAWDRILLTLAGSVPSLFGALTSWAKNVRQSREFSSEVSDGIRVRTQQQVEERLRPLCDQFHRAILKLRPREDRTDLARNGLSQMRLLGIEELQSRSQEIFDGAIDQNATGRWLVQFLSVIGTVLFWMLMGGPIFVLYRDFFLTSWQVWTGDADVHIDQFPHPTYGLFFTSLLLSLLPLIVYCMIVLTVMLSRGKTKRIARSVALEHERAIAELQKQQVIRLQFDDDLLHQAEFLLNLQNSTTTA